MIIEPPKTKQKRKCTVCGGDIEKFKHLADKDKFNTYICTFCGRITKIPRRIKNVK